MDKTNVNDVADHVLELAAMFDYPAPGVAADTALAETCIGVVGPGPRQIAIGTVSLHPNAALAANNAAYATISVFKRTAGGAAVLLASITTQVAAPGSNSWVAFTPFNLVVVAGAFVSPGDAITYSITQTGAGAPLMPPFIIAGYPKAN